MSNFDIAGRNPSLAGRGRVEHYRGRFVGGSAKPLFRTAKGRRKANLTTVDAFKVGLVSEQQRLGKGYSNIADLAVDRELAGVKLNAMGQPCGPDEEPQQAKNLSGDVFECLKQRFRNYSKTLDYASNDLKETYNEESKYKHSLPDEVLTAIVANIDVKALAKRARLTPPDLTGDIPWEEKKKREYLHQMNLRIRVREHARIIADGISKAYEAHMQNEPLAMQIKKGQMRQVPQSPYLAKRTLKNFPTAAVVRQLAKVGDKSLPFDVEATGAFIRQSFDQCFLEQQSQLKQENYNFIDGVVGIGLVVARHVGPVADYVLKNNRAKLALAAAGIRPPENFPIEKENYTPTESIEKKLKKAIGIEARVERGDPTVPTIETYNPGQGTMSEDWDRLPINAKEQGFWEKMKDAVNGEIAEWKTQSKNYKEQNPHLYDYIDDRARVWFGSGYDPDQDPSPRTPEIAANAACMEIENLGRSEDLEDLFRGIHACTKEAQDIRRGLARLVDKQYSYEAVTKTIKSLEKFLARAEKNDQKILGFFASSLYNKIYQDGGGTEIGEVLKKARNDFDTAHIGLDAAIRYRIKVNLEEFISGRERILSALKVKSIHSMSGEDAQSDLDVLLECQRGLKSIVKDKSVEIENRETVIQEMYALGTREGDVIDKADKSIFEAKHIIVKAKEALKELEQQIDLLREHLKSVKKSEASRDDILQMSRNRVLSTREAEQQLLEQGEQEQSEALRLGKYGDIAVEGKGAAYKKVYEKYGYDTPIQRWRTPQGLQTVARKINEAWKEVKRFQEMDLDSLTPDQREKLRNVLVSHLQTMRREMSRIDELLQEQRLAANAVYKYVASKRKPVIISETKKEEEERIRRDTNANSVPIEWRGAIKETLRAHTQHVHPDTAKGFGQLHDKDRSRVDFLDLERTLTTFKSAAGEASTVFDRTLNSISVQYRLDNIARVMPKLSKSDEIWKRRTYIESVEKGRKKKVVTKKRTWKGNLYEVVRRKARRQDTAELDEVFSFLLHRCNEIKHRHYRLGAKSDAVKVSLHNAVMALKTASKVCLKLHRNEKVLPTDIQEAYEEVRDQLSAFRSLPRPRKLMGQANLYHEIYHNLMADLEAAKAELEKNLPTEMELTSASALSGTGPANRSNKRREEPHRKAANLVSHGQVQAGNDVGSGIVGVKKGSAEQQVVEAEKKYELLCREAGNALGAMDRSGRHKFMAITAERYVRRAFGPGFSRQELSAFGKYLENLENTRRNDDYDPVIATFKQCIASALELSEILDGSAHR